MRGILLFIILIFTTYVAIGQDTWFKVVPGWRAVTTFNNSDTLVSFGLGIKNNLSDYVLINRINNRLEVIDTDTFDYSVISKNSSGNFLFFDNLVDFDTRTIGITFHKEHTKEKHIRNCDIFIFPYFERLNYNINVDTFETELGQYQEINGKYYGYIIWAVPHKEGEERVSDFGYRLLRFNNDTTVTILKEVFNDYINGSGSFKKIRYERVYGDNQDSSNLFLKRLYDVNGNTYKTEIDLLDSTGKVLWTCRPDASDSFNTTNLQIVQKPNGNLLCSWTNYYYSSGKKPGGHPYLEEYNENMTPHFAEIDYETGKVLWVKTQEQFIDWKMLKGNYVNTDTSLRRTLQNIKWVDAIRVNDSEVVWVGEKSIVFDKPFVVKILPVIFKTDLEGNPIWYRDYEIQPGSGTKDDFSPKSFIILPQDSGILLTGEYKGASGQQAALFKLDKNGCREQDCGKYDGIEELEKENSISLINIYPNPATTHLNIHTTHSSQNWQVKLYNYLGQEVMSIGDYKTSESINLKDYTRGMYYLTLYNAQNNVFLTKKVVLQ